MTVCLMTGVAQTQSHLPLHPNDNMVLGYDCSRPTALDVYDRTSFCDLSRPTPKPGHPTAAFKIAQVIWVSDVEGWMCTAISNYLRLPIRDLERPIRPVLDGLQLAEANHPNWSRRGMFRSCSFCKVIQDKLRWPKLCAQSLPTTLSEYLAFAYGTFTPPAVL